MALKHIIVVLVASAWSVAVPATAQTDEATFEPRLDALIEAQMRSQKIPGLAVALLRRGEVIVAKGYGQATLEHNVPVTRDTIFQSGSVGKMFTATAIMTLVEQGQIKLDDPLVKFLPDAPSAWQQITIRHLLTHISGIPDFEQEFDLKKDYTDEELVRHAYTLPLDFIPGKRWSYSNTGYMLLGIIATKVSGRSYLQTINRNVFQPLGMTTARGISEADIIPNRASGYRLVDDILKNQEWVSPTMNATADGALYFSLNDMIAWSRGVDKQALLSAASWKEILTPVKLNSGKPYPYGFGWNIDERGGQPSQYHGGGWQGFRSNYVRYLNDGVAIILLANSVNTDVDKLADGVAELWNPALTKLKPSIHPKPEPAIDRRVTELIKLARDGALAESDVSLAPKGLVGALNQYFPRLLAGYGPLSKLTLVDRRERGDDVIYTYTALLGDRPVKVEFWRAPDGHSARFMIKV